MKSLNKYSAVIVFLFLLPLVAKAQHYPVQAGLSVGTPCPQRLSSLFPLSGSRLQLSLLLTDIAQAEVSVRLHVKIEGAGLTVQSRPNPAMPVFMLQGGMPLTLGQQMEPYFRTDNLMASGNGATQFMQNGLMPEGFYTFTVTVFEHRRNVQISNAAQSFVWVIVNDPPQLVTPENNQILQPGGVQNIFFSWLPRHVVNPSSGSPIRYALSLWEVPQGMNAQVVVNTLPPLESVETPSTSLVWGADRMPLTPGKRYVAAVKAFDPNNEVGFKNNGLSVPHSFVYGQTCLSPVNLSHSNVTTQSADISWVAVGGGQNFRLEFKASSEPSGAYREIHVSQSHASLGNLSPNTSYDYRLSTVCGGYVSPPTASRSFTTLPIPVLNNECLSTVDVSAPNQSPLLTSLPAGQLFLAAGFPVEVGYTVPAGPNTFNGRGIIGLPMFGFGLRAEFEQIKVNQALQLVSGVVRVVKGDSLTIIGGGGSNGGGPGGVDFSNPNDTIFIPLPIDSVYANEDGTWSIVDTDGNTTIVTPSDGGTLVLGSDGNGVVIVGGQVYPVSTNPLAGGSGAGAGGSVQVTALCSQQLTFAPGGSMHRYGFDGYKAAMPPGSYPVLNVGEEQLHLPWKSVATGGSDRLLATPLSNSPISFAYQSGMPLSASSTADGYQLWTLNPPGGEDNLLALCQTDSAGQASVAGGVRVKTYPLQRQKLVVVPVGSSQAAFTKAQLQTTLNTIYAQAVSEWEVSIDAALPVLGIDDLSQGITVGETDYSEHMRQVWRALVMDRNPVPGAFYLFIIPGFKDHPAMTGYMPIKSGYGFLTPQSDARTAAHELGHGAFNLRHTFSNDNVVNLPEGTTANLMDYGQGTELWKYQWDYIHNPQGGWFLWEDVEEGAAFGGHISMRLKSVEFSEKNRVNIATFIPPATAIAYHGNGGSGKGISISIKPVFEAMNDNTANGFYVKAHVFTDSVDTPWYTGAALRVRKSSGHYSPAKSWTFELPDQVGFYPHFKVVYYASLTENGEYERMDSLVARLYTTFKVPVFGTIADNRLDERLLYFGGMQAQGARNEQAVLSRIWKKFLIASDTLFQSDFNPTLGKNAIGYYKPGLCYGKWDGALNSMNGNCVAFSEMLINSLLLQGVKAEQLTYFSSVNNEIMLVRQWDFRGSGTSGDPSYPYQNAIEKGRKEPRFSSATGEYFWAVAPEVDRIASGHRNAAAQNNPNPIADFRQHTMAKIGTQIYDPSYGVIYNSIEDFVSKAIDGFYKVDRVRIGGVEYDGWLIRRQY